MRIIRNLSIVAVMFAVVACNEGNITPGNSNEGKPDKIEGLPVNFEMTVGSMPLSKTTTSEGTDGARVVSWKAGDAVGIFVNDDATAHQYNFADGIWKGTTESDIIYALPSETYSFYAWYPYNVEIVKAVSSSVIEATVLSNQNNQYENNSGYDLSDVLMAKSEGVTGDKITNVELQYSHSFAMVEVLVSGNLVTKAPKKVILRNIKREASIDLINASVAPKADAVAENVVMYAVAPEGGTPANWLFRAIVPAQTIAADDMLLEVELDDKAYIFKSPVSGGEYVQAKYRRIEANIGEEKIGLTFPAGSINSWEPADGEIPPVTGEVKPEEPVDLITVKVADLTAETIKETANKDEYLNQTAGSFINESCWIMAKPVTTENITCTLVDNPEGKYLNLVAEEGAVFGWNKNALIYHHSAPFVPGYYCLTMKVKNYQSVSDDNGASKVAIFARTSETTQNPNAEGLYFAIKNAAKFDARKYISARSDAWTEVKVYFDFNNAFYGVSAVSTTEGAMHNIAADTEAYDYFNFVIAPNSPSAKLDISIKDITFIEVSKEVFDE